MTEFTYEELRKIYRNELNSSKLTPLESEFFENLHKLIQQQKKGYQKALTEGHLVYGHDLSNTKKLVEEIVSLREKKILSKVLLANKIESTDDAFLTREEKQVLSKMIELIETYRNTFQACFAETSEKTDLSEVSSNYSENSAEPFNKVFIRIIKDVPSFVGADMAEYGPFQTGVTLELPDKTASLLIHRKFAETAVPV
ncbi:MAG: hypothetical protein Q7S92_01390 [Candidatus Diapherotrites archaeon]|nr:hypothetical protein [Candidatus Diapherotrites archaeon]